MILVYHFCWFYQSTFNKRHKKIMGKIRKNSPTLQIQAVKLFIFYAFLIQLLCKSYFIFHCWFFLLYWISVRRMNSLLRLNCICSIFHVCLASVFRQVYAYTCMHLLMYEYMLHTYQLWFSVMISICCKEKLLLVRDES